MQRVRNAAKHLALNRSQWAAILYAALLSLACLAKGAVYDTLIAMLLVGCMPLLFMAASGVRSVHPMLKVAGIAVMATVVCVLLLQQWMPLGGDTQGVWHALQSITGQASADIALQDKAAWVQSVGRFLFLIMAFCIALFIGTSESSSRLFLQALLISGTLCVAFTFFTATNEGIPTTTYYSYRHGFVNPNNAAAYLGVILLLALAQAARSLRMPRVSNPKIWLRTIDQLTLRVAIKAGFLVFAVLLTIGGLFMTGSRAGIGLALFGSAFFCCLMIYKTQASKHQRAAMTIAIFLAFAGLIVWSFMNFGQVMVNKVETNGVSANTRFDIFAAMVPMITDHPLLGTGMGSFSGSFQPYRPQNISSDGIIDKAHNSYLEFAAEMGLPALLVLMGALAWMGYALCHGFYERKERYVIPALGLSVWLLAALYSLVDFPLQIPALAALFIAISTVCVSQSDRRFGEPKEKSSDAPSQRVRIRKRQRIKPLKGM